MGTAGGLQGNLRQAKGTCLGGGLGRERFLFPPQLIDAPNQEKHRKGHDNETDDVKRLLMICAEVKRLSEFTTDQLTIFLDNVREICNYNYEVLMNKTVFMHVRK